MDTRDKWISKIIKLVLILAVVGAILAYLYSVLSPPPVAVSFILSGAQTDALVIDMDADNQLGVNTVLSKDDAFLVLHTDEDITNHQNDIIKSQLVLEKFDRNRDGIIDGNDPVYSKLELMILENTPTGLKISYIPISQAGIRAINIDTKYLSPETRQRPNQLRRVIGVTIMADGSTRLLRDITIDESYLTGLNGTRQ